MARLTPRPTSRVLKALKRDGWELRKIKPGTKHYVLVHSRKPGILTVPRHGITKKGTLAKIIKAAGLSLTEFERQYH